MLCACRDIFSHIVKFVNGCFAFRWPNEYKLWGFLVYPFSNPAEFLCLFSICVCLGIAASVENVRLDAAVHCSGLVGMLSLVCMSVYASSRCDLQFAFCVPTDWDHGKSRQHIIYVCFVKAL